MGLLLLLNKGLFSALKLLLDPDDLGLQVMSFSLGLLCGFSLLGQFIQHLVKPLPILEVLSLNLSDLRLRLVEGRAFGHELLLKRFDLLLRIFHEAQLLMSLVFEEIKG